MEKGKGRRDKEGKCWRLRDNERGVDRMREGCVRGRQRDKGRMREKGRR